MMLQQRSVPVAGALPSPLGNGRGALKTGAPSPSLMLRSRSCVVLRQAPRLVCTAQAASASLAPAPQRQQHQHLAFKLAAAVMATWNAMVQRLQQKLRETAEKAKELDVQAAVDSMRRTRKSFKVYTMVAPFAAVTSTADTFLLVSKAVGSFVKLYLLLLFIRVLLSWFPTFNWENQPWLALRQVTDPYLNLFRGLVPPLMGTIDFTPLFGFLILQFLAAALNLDDGEDDW